VQLPVYLGIAHKAECHLADALALVADRHSADAEVRDTARLLARWSRRHAAALAPFIRRYGAGDAPDPDRLRAALFHGQRVGALGVLSDVTDLLVLARAARSAWTAVFQAAMELHDAALRECCREAGEDVDRQIAWLETRLRWTAPQALTVPPSRLHALRASIPKAPTPPALPDALWAPVAGAALTLAVGLVALLIGRPWLAPSLGPTAYLVAATPAHPASRFANTVLGHAIGLAVGFAAVALLGAWSAPSVLGDRTLAPERMWAAVIAVALTLAGCLTLRLDHPPAAATTLLVALGALPGLADAANVVGGAAAIGAAGAAARRLRLGQWPRRPLAHRRAPAGAPAVTQAAGPDLRRAA